MQNWMALALAIIAIWGASVRSDQQPSRRWSHVLLSTVIAIPFAVIPFLMGELTTHQAVTASAIIFPLVIALCALVLSARGYGAFASGVADAD